MHKDTESVLGNLAFETAIAKLHAMQEVQSPSLKPFSAEDWLLSSESMLDIPEFVRNFIGLNDVTRAMGWSLLLTTQFSDELRLVMLGIEFSEFPIAVLAGYLLSKKISITPVRTIKWLYATTALALMFTAFMLPVSAPMITLFLAVSSLLTTAYTLYYAFTSRSKLLQEKKQLKSELQRIEADFAALLQQANLLEEQMVHWVAELDEHNFAVSALEKALQEASIENKEKIKQAMLLQDVKNAALRQHIGALYQEVTVLEEQCRIQQATLYILKEKDRLLDCQLEKYNLAQIVDKAIGVSLAKLGIIAFSITLVSPLGWHLLTGLAILAAVYLTIKLLIQGFQWLSTCSGRVESNEPVRNTFPETIELTQLSIEKPSPIQPNKTYAVERNLRFHHNVPHSPEFGGDWSGQAFAPSA